MAPAKKELLQGHTQLLVDGLKRIFGEFDQEMLERVLPRFEWLELGGGEVLFRQGERDDSLYFVVSGRLRAVREDAEHTRTVLGEIARGETVGELAFFTGEPRMATIAAVRDSLLARVGSEVFRELLMAYPQVALNLTRLVIGRMKHNDAARGGGKPMTIGLVPLAPALDALEAAQRMAQTLSALGPTLVVTAARVGEWLGDPGAAQAPRQDLAASARLAHKLEQVEGDHQFVLLVADPGPSEWTRRCLRHSDHILLFADTREDPALAPVEAACLQGAQREHNAACSLVLVHPPETAVPRGTARWLAPRELAGHFHVRADRAADWARLSRVVSGNGVGLVLSGGGARGFAHLGVMKALQEAGIGYDLLGGTSIGSVMAAFGAMDIPIEEAIDRARSAFRENPTGDYNLLPMLSLIGGKRLRRVIDQGVHSIMGEGCGIEDLWKGYFCVSSNYSAMRETVLTRGPLAKSIRASVSIPGALPPVMLDGELHIDGGTFNNFPTDVMAQRGAGRIIGVNLLREGTRKYQGIEELPGSWQLMLDKMRGKRNRLPGLVPLLLNASIMYSYARQAEAKRYVDLYFAPGVHGYGMLDWSKFDRIVQAGYEYAREQLQGHSWHAAARDSTSQPAPSELLSVAPLATAG
ncbi:patatin-like phospholipase family protein [Ramlibacter tataouinensis]|uniref:patatin-like phospholipase family protein n=1 Tax=Ramlibacter tataouinensis TaxID=94132 RepID=UPI0009EEF2F7|nr:patatin-like phospholipase family protein [Ramlibacter tataouinensis]